MVESGDWVTPRLYGKPWFEKPVLYYWGAALSFKLFGVSEAAARVPSAVAALLATLAMAWLAWRVHGAEVARWLLLLLPASVGMIGFSHAAATDMAFAGMLTIAMVFGAVVVGLVPRKRGAYLDGSNLLAIVGLGFFLGLAVLAKGPAAIILSGGAVFFWAVCTKRWRDGFRCVHPMAIASFCATALPWYVLCARRNPDFFRIFIVEHNFKRYLTPEFQHVQPFWFYLPVVLASVFPWTLFLVAGVCRLAARLRSGNVLDPTLIFACCWGIFPLVFFSLSRSKLPGYILPAAPPLGLLMAKMVSSDDRKTRGLTAGVIVASAVVCIGTVILVSRFSDTLLNRLAGLSPLLTFLFADLALVFALWGGSFLFAMAPRAARALQLCGFGCFLIVLPLIVRNDVLEGFGISGMSARDVARSARFYGATFENLRLADVRRSAHYQLNFYFHADLKDWDGVAAQGNFILGDRISCDKLRVDLECKDLWEMIDRSGNWALLKLSAPLQ
jgi:4-amino-4-deoxy-L-arabinose transferase-like glycosyltransferase